MAFHPKKRRFSSKKKPRSKNAKHTTLPSSTAAKIILAKNPATSTQLLTKLSRSSVENIRIALVQNPACPAKILSHLAHDSKENVRFYVASHLNTPMEDLFLLAQDPSPGIKNMAWLQLNPQVLTIGQSNRDVLQHLRQTDTHQPHIPPKPTTLQMPPPKANVK